MVYLQGFAGIIQGFLDIPAADSGAAACTVIGAAGALRIVSGAFAAFCTAVSMLFVMVSAALIFRGPLQKQQGDIGFCSGDIDIIRRIRACQGYHIKRFSELLQGVPKIAGF